MALPFFPGNEKLKSKMRTLEDRIRSKKEVGYKHTSLSTQPLSTSTIPSTLLPLPEPTGHIVAQKNAVPIVKVAKRAHMDDSEDEDFAPEDDNDASYASDSSFKFKTKVARKPKKVAKKLPIFRDTIETPEFEHPHALSGAGEQSPRTAHLLKIINSRDVNQIKALKGVGVKKADAIVSCLIEMETEEIRDLESLAMMKGVGGKTVENMRVGLTVDYDF